MKYLATAATIAFFISGATVVKADTATLGKCLAAVRIAELHGNVWQAEFSMEECANIAGKAIDDAMALAAKPKCEEDQFESKGQCYNSLGDIPGRTRGGQRR